MTFNDKWNEWAVKMAESTRKDWAVSEKVREMQPDFDLRVMVWLFGGLAVFALSTFASQLLNIEPWGLLGIAPLGWFFVSIYRIRKKAENLLKVENPTQ